MFILILSLISISAISSTDLCDLLNDETISAITSSRIPNCLTEEKIYLETDMATNNTVGVRPICETCRPNFNARSAINNDERNEIKKRAYFDSMYSEFEKAMVSLLGESIALRQLDSTGSKFDKSIKACNANDISSKMQSCDDGTKELFQSKNYNTRMANEIVATISLNSGVNGILERNQNNNQCPITDQMIVNLTPRLLEESITLEQITRISSLNPSNQDALFDQLGGDLANLIRNHPVLRNLAKNPTSFINLFKQVKERSSTQNLKDVFKDVVYNSRNGNFVDEQIAARCSQAISTFTSKICSPKFKQAQMKLGPMANLNRYLNEWTPPSDEQTLTEDLLSRNVAALEFCDVASPAELSLDADIKSMNGWLPQDEMNATFKSFTGDKYRKTYGTPKSLVCAFLPATTCTENSPACKLFKIYQESIKSNSPLARLSINSDANVNKLVGAFVSSNSNIPANTREILIREGILPQSNGQFVERPQIPERQPEYLAGVANGTITPNVSGSSAAQSQASNSPRRNSQSQAQTQVFQPGQGNSAVSETQIAANSEDDSEALRRFEQGLDDRLRRVEGQQSTGTARSAQPARRPASRPDSSSRTNDQTQSAEFIPSQTDAPTQISGVSAVAPSAVSEARLGQDTSRRGLASRQKNTALEEMDRKNNPVASSETGSNSTSEEVPFRPEASLTLNIESGANLERVLASNESLKSLIQEQKPFRFKLNNNVFNVQFINGKYTVSFHSGANSGRTVATTLEGIFNNSMGRSPSADRNATLEGLGNTLRN